MWKFLSALRNRFYCYTSSSGVIRNFSKTRFLEFVVPSSADCVNTENAQLVSKLLCVSAPFFPRIQGSILPLSAQSEVLQSYTSILLKNNSSVPCAIILSVGMFRKKAINFNTSQFSNCFSTKKPLVWILPSVLESEASHLGKGNWLRTNGFDTCVKFLINQKKSINFDLSWFF